VQLSCLGLKTDFILFSFCSYTMTLSTGQPLPLSQNQVAPRQLDPVQQSMDAAGVPPHDHPTSSTSANKDRAIDDDDDLGLDDPLSPRDDDSPRILRGDYQTISPSEPRHQGESFCQSSQQPESLQSVHQSGHQSGHQLASFNQSNNQGSSNQFFGPSQPEPHHSGHQPATSGLSNQGSSSQYYGLNPMKSRYETLVGEADTVLPNLEDFERLPCDPQATRARVLEVVQSLKAGIEELCEIGVVKSQFEEQYANLYSVITTQRICVRQMRERCRKAMEGSDKEFEDAVLAVVSSSDESKLKDLEMDQIKSKMKQYELTITQLQATVEAKEADIRLLEEQLRQARSTSSTSSNYKSPKGKAPVSSRHPYLKRSVPLPRRDLLASIETPRHEYEY